MWNIKHLRDKYNWDKGLLLCYELHKRCNESDYKGGNPDRFWYSQGGLKLHCSSKGHDKNSSLYDNFFNRSKQYQGSPK